jgi:hypothetical protein
MTHPEALDRYVAEVDCRSEGSVCGSTRSRPSRQM